ncbi:ribonuclease HI family protein [Liquorilactobacillus hordei]|uniref:Ribonuclease H n=1 Tax=Liquorilactobacillus hordei DSM 19519 TaxID=1423759 RepID=A0A0R1MI84_9LACO|nr:ribonuclease HI family protein [Liquorilactobacillus hordei]KRL07638.1 ribonuclease H [Liquorilactobacillus hordei DSM 19519]
MITLIKLFTDAATKGNPGPSTAGILIIKDGQQFQYAIALPDSSNHTAEFLAALTGLQYVEKLFGNAETLMFFSDSRIVIESIAKNYSKKYNNFLVQIITLQAKFPLVVNQWIPEKKNHGAHTLATQKLHSILKE